MIRAFCFYVRQAFGTWIQFAASCSEPSCPFRTLISPVAFDALMPMAPVYRSISSSPIARINSENGISTV